MKKLFAAAVVAALCTVPGMSRAETPNVPRYLAAPAAPTHDAQAQQDDASTYAAREKKAPPLLAEFAGGDSGVYITTGAIALALAIVLLIVLL